MASKSFKDINRDLFKPKEPAPEEILQEVKQPAPEAKPQARPAEIPDEEEEPMPAKKSVRLQLLIRPDENKLLAKEARKLKISKNELINRILEEHSKGAK